MIGKGDFSDNLIHSRETACKDSIPASRPLASQDTNFRGININSHERTNMKKILLTLACAAVAPLAFAQTSSTTQTTETNPLTGPTQTTTTTSSTDGTVTTFEAGKTIVVRRVGLTDPITYTLGKTVHYVNRTGNEIEASSIHPGARVHVYYDRDGDTQVVNRVVVDDND
jgi:hypothetical protein